MRKWLQDPKIVTGLGIFALLYMGFTFFPDSSPPHAKLPTKISETVTESQDTVSTGNPAPPPAELDSAIRSLLDSIRWMRRSNRDPFVVERRRGAMAYWVLGEAPPHINARPQAKRNKGSAPLRLQAVAIGPAGKIALVNGIWFSEGVRKGKIIVDLINPDSVRIRTGKNSQVLRFSKAR